MNIRATNYILVILLLLAVYGKGLFQDSIHVHDVDQARSGIVKIGNIFSLGCLLSIFLITGKVRGFAFKFNRDNWLMNVLYVVMFLSAIISINPIISISKFFQLLVLIYAARTVFNHSGNIESFMAPYRNIVLVFSITCLLFPASQVGSFIDQNRIAGNVLMYIPPNEMAELMLFSLAFSIFLYYKKKQTFVDTINIVVGILLIFGTKSRFAYLIVALIVFLYLLTNIKRFAIIFFAGFLAILYAVLQTDFIEVYILRDGDSSKLLELTGRVKYWAFAIENIDLKSLLIGHGFYFGSRFYLPTVDPHFAYKSNLDNTYLEVLFNSGIIALLLFIMVLFKMFSISLKRRYDSMLFISFIMIISVKSLIGPSIVKETISLVFFFLTFHFCRSMIRNKANSNIEHQKI
ncbi:MULTISPECIES: O-antigen ligase family protein [unclassified Allomuricauda]|uniref:O-antigen ligase family protein n=1 Tax=unclassified Allomuricauda TaxID=2615049 RepID=UPI00273F9CFC|nr:MULTISPECIES: O-antigen ligase family protein [unclassified Allomuricauda]